jgi:hypothetical protein
MPALRFTLNEDGATVGRAISLLSPHDPADTIGVDGNSPARPVNRYLYENLLSNTECQIESWNLSAARESNLQAAREWRLRAEGLGYALRLLGAFQPEFRELIDTAIHSGAVASGEQERRNEAAASDASLVGAASTSVRP